MITREINNIGAPFTDEAGNPIGGVVIQFTPVDANGNPADALDILSGEHILPQPVTKVASSINTNTGLQIGEFSVDLWPTDRADRVIFYKCKVLGVPGSREWVRPLITGDGNSLSWYEFLRGVPTNEDQIVKDSTGDAVLDSEGNVVTDSLGG
jgi:hypothetical protein